MIYTVILNSNLRVSGSVANATYLFDWGIMKEGQYKMTWGFCSGSVTVNMADVILISAELGQNSVFLASPTLSRASNTNIIGTLIPNETGSTFMYGDKNSNGPIILSNPRNNQFIVKLLTNDATPTEWVDSSSLSMGEYILSLTFESISS